MSPVRGFRGGDHETFDELAVGWALHALEPEDEALFTLHLPDCARCARTVAETSEVMAALATDLPPAEPSEALRERIRDQVSHTEQVPPPVLPPIAPVPPPAEHHEPARAGRPEAVGFPARPGPSTVWRPTRIRRTGWRSRLPQAAMAAAAALVVGLGVWNVVLSTSRQQAQQVAAEQSQILRSVLSPGQAKIAPLTDSNGHRVATVVARPGQIQVVASGLEVNNESSSTYVVWGMGKGLPKPLGTFDVVQPQLDLRTVGSDHTGLDGYDGYAISLEPGRKAPSTPTDIVARG